MSFSASLRMLAAAAGNDWSAAYTLRYMKSESLAVMSVERSCVAAWSPTETLVDILEEMKSNTICTFVHVPTVSGAVVTDTGTTVAESLNLISRPFVAQFATADPKQTLTQGTHDEATPASSTVKTLLYAVASEVSCKEKEMKTVEG